MLYAYVIVYFSHVEEGVVFAPYFLEAKDIRKIFPAHFFHEEGFAVLLLIEIVVNYD